MGGGFNIKGRGGIWAALPRADLKEDIEAAIQIFESLSLLVFYYFIVRFDNFFKMIVVFIIWGIAAVVVSQEEIWTAGDKQEASSVKENKWCIRSF